METEPIPKPFGLPDKDGFYTLGTANKLATKTAILLIPAWERSINYLALAGYEKKSYPEGTQEHEFDWTYHMLAGLRSTLSTQEKQAAAQALKEAIPQAYEQARSSPRVYWNHGPLKVVTIDEDNLQGKIAQGDTKEVARGSLLHALMFSAVPVWEKPGVVKDWKGNIVTPFEYAQQFVFQFHMTRVENPIYIARVTGDKDNERHFILE